MTKKQKKNDRDVPKYYVENNHEPIVKRELFLAVQEEIKKRQSTKISKDIIANKVICGLCNGHFGKRVWHSNDKYRTIVYRCIDKYKGDTCKNTYIKEEEIKDIFVKALNKTIENKDEIIENIKNIKSIIPDENTLIIERDKMEHKLTELADRINAIVRDSARGIDSGDYDKRVLEYETMKEESINLSKKIDNIIERKSKLDLFIKNIETMDIVTEWAPELWGTFLDKMLIYKDKVEVIFNYGETVTINR